MLDVNSGICVRIVIVDKILVDVMIVIMVLIPVKEDILVIHVQEQLRTVLVQDVQNVHGFLLSQHVKVILDVTGLQVDGVIVLQDQIHVGMDVIHAIEHVELLDVAANIIIEIFLLVDVKHGVLMVIGVMTHHVNLMENMKVVTIQQQHIVGQYIIKIKEQYLIVLFFLL
jgi:hypothetical protein